MEILDSKRTEMENLLERFNNRSGLTEERFIKLEDRQIKIMQFKNQREKRIKKSDKRGS